MARATAPSKHSGDSYHPPYAEMIFSAIGGLNEKNGSSRKAIAKFIKSSYSNLPHSHEALLTRHLKRMKQKGQILMIKHSYKLSKQQPNSVVQRGRGRPPKPKPAEASSAPRRGRGRPRKTTVVGPAVVKKPRGRPRKEEASVASIASSGVTKMRRGRPPKKKAVDGGDDDTKSKRGRPKKVLMDGIGVKKRPVGRPRKLGF